jgi:alpha-glucan,water dikinase
MKWLLVTLYYIMLSVLVNRVFLVNSVPMDEEEKVVLDYSSDKLMIDGSFRQSILSSIARAGHAIEELYGTPQDIEGVIKDGKVYVVQTRPQV